MSKFPIHQTYLEIAKSISKRSYSNRKQVGVVLVKDSNIISYGWNGTPHGFDNNCELDDGSTNPLVIHAEANALMKCAKSGISTNGAILYQTLSPCIECAKLIIQAGITEVHFIEEYRDNYPLEILLLAKIAYFKLETKI